MRTRKTDAPSVSRAREIVDYPAARVAQAQQFRDLVESLAGGVVARTAETPIAAEIFDREERGMPARHDQREKRERNPLLDERGQDVPLDMVDTDHRLARRLHQALRAHQADQQRADEARPAGHGDTIDVAEGAPGGFYRALNQGHDRDDVIARRELGHDSTVGAVDVVLVGDAAGAHGHD